MTPSRVSQFALSGGRRVFKSISHSVSRIKPLLNWVDPGLRSRLRRGFTDWVFDNFYRRGGFAAEKGMLPPRSALAGHGASVPQASSLLPGVNLIGFPRVRIGDGEFIRQTARSFQAAGVGFSLLEVPSALAVDGGDERFTDHIRRDNPYKINIFYLKPDQMPAAVVQLGESCIRNRYNIGYWTWELAEFPDAWGKSLDFLDEVWCPSRFIQTAIAAKARNPVIHAPFPIEMDASPGWDRSRLGLPEDAFIFLFAFDFKSGFARKNPLACIEAFKKAFPAKNKQVALVIKSMDGSLFPDQARLLEESVRTDPRILHMSQSLPWEAMAGLMQNCDSFVSLHRSEGIGLGMAQSMLLGKPVIATGYSGNTDFMHDGNACMVDHELVPVREGEYPFAPGQEWAEPDVDQAAWFMQRLLEKETFRDTIAREGQDTLRLYYNAAFIGSKYKRRLQTLGLSV